ncbi:MAG: hypothetical protein GY798_12635 [Hyphomicrobiales bacterium]|nr:hypothetical protein [Hyphomicrobiales bacterium]
MSNWRQEWVTQKVEIAECLFNGECKGSYPEAVLITSATINAIASNLWPGKGIDRKRFVELLIKYASADPSPTTVSVPLLVQHLIDKGRNPEAKLLQEKYLNVCDSLVLLGNDIDKSEIEIQILCSTLDLKTLRKYCYANIFYEEVRSSYVHEYAAGEKSDSHSMSGARNAKVHYTNTINMPRRIHFHINWLREVALLTAKSADSICSLPLAKPAKWWIEG